MNPNKELSETADSRHTPRILTIGVYGYSEEAFFQALQGAGVDTFCDIRGRRGVRGATYAFANSKRLQARLAELGIKYHHLPELAPTAAIRERQKRADKAAKVAKRKRAVLDQSFVEAYQDEILTAFDARSFMQEMGGQAQVIALFCVEKEPEACHRSLVAEELERELGLEVQHKIP